MSKYLKNYNIPKDLSGKTVLDVGAQTGYFSFEFAKRGAKKVVALDIKKNHIIKSANQLMNTNVKIVKKDLFRLNEGFGKFDLVFCSNVLIHVKDIFTAICKLREVTRNQVIISTVILNQPNSEFPFAKFVGVEKPIPAGSFWSYWQPNLTCLQKMMEVQVLTKLNQFQTLL